MYRVAWAVKITDRATSPTTTIFSTEPFYDADSGLQAEPFLVGPVEYGFTMPGDDESRGFIGGFAVPTISNFKVSMGRSGASGDNYRPMQVHEAGIWGGSAFTAHYWSGEETSDPPDDLTTWTQYATGTVSRAIPRSENAQGHHLIDQILEFHVIDREDFISQARIARLRGFGTAIPHFEGGGSVNFGDHMNPGNGSWAYFISMKFRSGELAGGQTVFQKGNGTTTGIRLRADYDSSGKVRFRAFGLSSDTLTSEADAILDDGKWRTVGARFDKDAGTFSLWIDGEKISESTSVTGPVTATTDDFEVSPSNSVDGELTHLAFFPNAPVDSDMKSWTSRELIPDDSPTAYYKGFEGSTWTDVAGSTDGTASGTVTKISSDSGIPSDVGKTMPWTAGFVRGVPGWAVRPSNWEILLDPHGLSQLKVFIQGDEATITTHYTVDTDSGVVTITSAPGGSIETVRCEFQGGLTPAATYEDIIKLALTTDGVGVLDAATEVADPMIIGAQPLGTVGYHVVTATDPPVIRDIVSSMLAGADCVGYVRSDGKFEAIRVPIDPFAISEATRISGGDPGHADFAETSLVKIGNAGAPVNLFTSTYAHNWGGKLARGDMHSAATDEDRAFFTASHAVASHPSAESDDADAESAHPVTSHYATNADVLPSLTRRSTSGQTVRDSKRYLCRLDRPVPELMFLGAKVSVSSITPNLGLTHKLMTVIGYEVGPQSPFGELEMLECRRVRSVPTSLEQNTFTSGGLSDIDESPESPDGTGLEMSGVKAASTIRAAMPPSPAWDPTYHAAFRFRMKGARINNLSIFEAGVQVSPIQAQLTLIDGDSLFPRADLPGPTEEAYYQVLFLPTDLADSTGADLEFFCIVERENSGDPSNQFMALDLCYVPA